MFYCKSPLRNFWRFLKLCLPNQKVSKQIKMKIIFKILLFFGFLIVFLVLFFSLTRVLLSPISELKNQGKACFGENCFGVEVAKTPEELEYGLMFRQQLDKDRGMLFIFEKEDVYPFWMKNTLIPLDIIWINKENKIVFIKNNAEPCPQTDCKFINPGIKANYVLEINSGIVESLDLKTGDNVLLNY